MRITTKEMLLQFGKFLKQEAKSRNTQEKYLQDVAKFEKFAGGTVVTKELVLAYKQQLLESGYGACLPECFTRWKRIL